MEQPPAAPPSPADLQALRSRLSGQLDDLKDRAARLMLTTRSSSVSEDSPNLHSVSALQGELQEQLARLQQLQTRASRVVKDFDDDVPAMHPDEQELELRLSNLESLRLRAQGMLNSGGRAGPNFDREDQRVVFDDDEAEEEDEEDWPATGATTMAAEEEDGDEGSDDEGRQTQQWPKLQASEELVLYAQPGEGSADQQQENEATLAQNWVAGTAAQEYPLDPQMQRLMEAHFGPAAASLQQSTASLSSVDNELMASLTSLGAVQERASRAVDDHPLGQEQCGGAEFERSADADEQRCLSERQARLGALHKSANGDAELRLINSLKDSMQQEELELRLSQLSRLSARAAAVSRLEHDGQDEEGNDDEDEEENLDHMEPHAMLAEALNNQTELLQAVQAKVGLIDRALLDAKSAQREAAQAKQLQEAKEAPLSASKNEASDDPASVPARPRAPTPNRMCQLDASGSVMPHEAELTEAARQLAHEQLDELVHGDEANLPFLLRTLHGLTGLHSQQQRGQVVQLIQQLAGQDVLDEIHEVIDEELEIDDDEGDAEEAALVRRLPATGGGEDDEEDDEDEDDEEDGEQDDTVEVVRAATALRPVTALQPIEVGHDRGHAAEPLSPGGRPKTARGRPGQDPFYYVSPSNSRDKASCQQLHLDGPSSRRAIAFDASPLQSPAGTPDRHAASADEAFDVLGDESDEEDSEEEEDDAAADADDDDDDEDGVDDDKTDDLNPFLRSLLNKSTERGASAHDPSDLGAYVWVSEGEAADSNGSWSCLSASEGASPTAAPQQVDEDEDDDDDEADEGVRVSDLPRQRLAWANEMQQPTIEQLRERLDQLGRIAAPLAAPPSCVAMGDGPTQTDILNKRLLESFKASLDSVEMEYSTSGCK